MRGPALLLILTALALAPTASAQQMCRIDWGFGSSEYPCGDEEAPAEPEPWYASNTFQAILGVVGILGSLGAGGYTYYRVRSRRRMLTGTLASIERAYADAKADPGAGVGRLAHLRAEVRAAHEKGRLDDAHFLELDKRATTYLVKLRLLEIDRRFPHLPPLLLAEIRRLLSDGLLSPAEADLIEVRALAYRVHDATRAELVSLTRGWAADDAPEDEAPALAA